MITRLPRFACSRFVGLALVATLSACGTPLTDPQGPVGRAELLILIDAMLIMLAIAIPTIVATLVFAWWFRASNTRARYRPDFVYSGRIELLTWSVPMLVVLFLGGVTWIGAHRLDPAVPLPSAKPPLNVDVVSLDWKWLFIYPDQGVASVNQLVIPAGTPVHFHLTSASVMNTFFVPELGSMIYTMNGMSDQLWLQADRPGSWQGRSGHFSGDGFSDMHFAVDAVPQSQFAAWAGAARGNGPTLDAAAYAALARPRGNLAPFTYRAVTPHLYDDIVAQRLAPAPGK
jgi:cytochrome o ubiquinol oxidase subunit 2